MTAARDLSASQRWTELGTEGFLAALAGIGDDRLAEPTTLPGWTGRHLVAHVAANADALLNLARWAATGEETPMYSSPQQRNADIDSGARLAPADLRSWVARSAECLAEAFVGLTDEHWSRLVRTAQGRVVPAREIPWLRAREVLVHTVDLDPTSSFADLPEDFLIALVEDVIERRSTGEPPALELSADGGRYRWSLLGQGQPSEIRGSLSGVAAYLTGRAGAHVVSTSGAVSDLPPWL